MSRAQDLRHLTQLFPTFLGLRLVPVGLWFLAVALVSPLPGLHEGLLGALAALAAGAIWWVHLWYRREFGVVEPRRLGMGRSWALLLGLGVAVAAFGLGASRLGGTASLVLVLVLVLFVTAVLFALPRVFGGGLKVIALLAGVVLLGAVVLLAAGRDPVRFNHLGALFSLSVGAILIAAGAIEHRLMTRALDRLAGSPRESE